MSGKRGYLPEDDTIFAPDALETMRTVSRHVCYLIDEGYSVGDATFRNKSEQIFKERRAHATCLVISHSASLVRKTCDKAAILKDGHLHMFETVDDALARYKEMCDARK